MQRTDFAPQHQGAQTAGLGEDPATGRVGSALAAPRDPLQDSEPEGRETETHGKCRQRHQRAKDSYGEGQLKQWQDPVTQWWVQLCLNTPPRWRGEP
jgi:hypothetical protein